MKILYICKLYSSKGNGVIGALNNEIKYLQYKCDVALYNLGVQLNKTDIKNIYHITKFPNISLLPDGFDLPDLVVFEEIYKPEYIKIYKYLIKKNVPYIIIPHGSLVDLEQKRKFFKKKLANLLLFNKFISNAYAIQYLNDMEKTNSKFKINNYIIFPNGLEITDLPIQIKPASDNFEFVFIGRYSIYTKGLDLMLKSFNILRSFCLKNNIKLSLYGVDEDGKSIRKLKKYIDKNMMNDYVTVNGPVYNNIKNEIIKNANVFIQLSRHEAQPMGIIEAMALGTPCLVTYETSFGHYCDEKECGIGTSASVDEIVLSIKKIFSEKQKYDIYQKNTIANVKKDFDLKKITDRTYEKYKLISRKAK